MTGGGHPICSCPTFRKHVWQQSKCTSKFDVTSKLGDEKYAGRWVHALSMLICGAFAGVAQVLLQYMVLPDLFRAALRSEMASPAMKT